MKKTMKFSCLIIISLHIFSWVGVSSRLLASNTISGKAQSPESHKFNLIPLQDQGTKFLKGEEQMKQEKMYKKLGSSPPSCEYKCYGCMPCEPTQVPTDTSSVKPQYTNYEPLDWKCKCGPSFYSP